MNQSISRLQKCNGRDSDEEKCVVQNLYSEALFAQFTANFA